MNSHNVRRNLRRLLPLFLFFSTISFNFAQTGPAGVANGARIPIWLDAHELGYATGTPTSIWNDLSGNDNHFSQSDPIRYPAFNASGINGVSSVTFDGINDVLQSGTIPALTSNEITYFMVYNRLTTSNDMIINTTYDGGFEKWRTYMNGGQNTVISAHYSPVIKWVRYTDPVGPSFLSTHITPTQISTYNQGSLAMNRSATYTVPTSHEQVYIGNRNNTTTGGYSFDGEIAELIIFNSTVSDLERILIENYLGAKYQMTIPTDYFAYDATHRFGMVALGNDGINSQTQAQGSGILEFSNPTELDADEYLLAAHTDFAPDEYNLVNLPASLGSHQRLERTWRVDETGETGTITLTFKLGAYHFGSPDSYRLLVDSNDDFTDATIVTGTFSADELSVTFDVNLADGQYFTLAGVQSTLEIHSITTGPWSSSDTWDCSCVPTINDQVYIDPATIVDVDVDGYAAYLSVETGGELTASADITLSIIGNLDIDGMINFTDGTIALTGNEEQNVTLNPVSATPIELYNLLVDNSGGEDINFQDGTIHLNGTLHPNRGQIIIAPSMTFVVTSTSAVGGGRIGPIIPPTTISGNVSVQRYLPPGVTDWRNLCSPVVGSTFDDWDPDLAMSGPDFPDGCASDPDEPCFKSVVYTDHSTLFTVLSSTTPILNGRGFEVYVGSNPDTFDGTTLTSTGTVHDYTNVSRTYQTGWATIGNPYASAITFGTLSKTSPISDYYYVYDANSGAYEWYDETSGTSSIPEITSDGLIATGQAVWIYATSLGTITYRQADKTDTEATFIRGPQGTSTALKLTLSEEASHYNCTVFLEERAGASDGNEDELDIRHLSTGREKAPSFAFQSSEELWRKNVIAADGADKFFQLVSSPKQSGRHTINLDNARAFDHYQKILLYDYYTGEYINLKEKDYTFLATPQKDSLPDSRFALILSNNEQAPPLVVAQSTVIEQTIQLKQLGSMISIQLPYETSQLATIAITDLLGRDIIYTQSIELYPGNNTLQLPEGLKGIYLFNLSTQNEMKSIKLIH